MSRDGGSGIGHPVARAMRAAGLTTVDVAARLGVDAKTVQRWRAGRLPRPRHRAALQQLTGWRESELWPPWRPAAAAQPAHTSPASPASSAELRAAYGRRSEVPARVWHALFAGAREVVDVVAYSCLFLAEDAVALELLRQRARAGVRIRLALGDPDGVHVAARGAEEGIDDLAATRIRNAAILLQPLTAEPGVELRLHDTVLYTSVYRADDDLLVNLHAYGCPAAHAPVLHLCRTGDDGAAAAYLAAAERVWAQARQP